MKKILILFLLIATLPSCDKAFSEYDYMIMIGNAFPGTSIFKKLHEDKEVGLRSVHQYIAVDLRTLTVLSIKQRGTDEDVNREWRTILDTASTNDNDYLCSNARVVNSILKCDRGLYAK